MKPLWDDAPEWAQWLAMDDDKTWYWFEHKPKHNRDGIWRCTTGMITYAGATKYEPILEQRP